MSVLVMAMVGMTVGSDPTRISTETAFRFFLDREWEGTWDGTLFDTLPNRVDNPRAFKVVLKPGELVIRADDNSCVRVWRWEDTAWIDEGNGRFRLATEYLGIYKREAGRVIISLKRAENGRPTSFRSCEDQTLLILKPAKK